jgi:hypothetical protein
VSRLEIEHPRRSQQPHVAGREPAVERASACDDHVAERVDPLHGGVEHGSSREVLLGDVDARDRRGAVVQGPATGGRQQPLRAERQGEGPLVVTGGQRVLVASGALEQRDARPVVSQRARQCRADRTAADDQQVVVAGRHVLPFMGSILGTAVDGPADPGQPVSGQGRIADHGADGLKSCTARRSEAMPPEGGDGA